MSVSAIELFFVRISVIFDTNKREIIRDLLNPNEAYKKWVHHLLNKFAQTFLNISIFYIIILYILFRLFTTT